MYSTEEFNQKKIATSLIERMNVIIPQTDRLIPLHEPEFDERECELVLNCLRSGWVSSVGSYVTDFENSVADFCNVNYGVAVVNGTAGLELALKACGVKPDDEVLLPSLTFVATANAVSNLGAIPHFLDVDQVTLGIDPEKMEGYLTSIADLHCGNLVNRKTGRKISLLVVMHTFGHPVDMDNINRVCRKFEIPCVEDAAEALGSEYKGRKCGSLGNVAVVSFNGNKIITTGGGGAVLTNDREIADRVRHLSTTAKIAHQWEFDHDMVAHNYRLPNLNASLGMAQMEKLPQKIKAKRKLAEKYIQLFADFGDCKIFKEPITSSSNYWLNTLILKNTSGSQLRDFLLQELNDKGYQARPCWKLMHELSFYKDCPRSDMQTSEKLYNSIINLPSSANLVR
ncbi:LegC family aminotransferase [bacterium]|nr:LegC family aminotransferase [bacterium]